MIGPAPNETPQRDGAKEWQEGRETFAAGIALRRIGGNRGKSRRNPAPARRSTSWRGSIRGNASTISVRRSTRAVKISGAIYSCRLCRPFPTPSQAAKVA